MWEELLDDFDLDVDGGPNLNESIFIGDAGGRAPRNGQKGDHSGCDRWERPRNFAVDRSLTRLQRFCGQCRDTVSYA